MAMYGVTTLLACWCLLIGLFGTSQGLIHRLSLRNDEASSLLIETFAFGVGGFQNITNSVVKAFPVALCSPFFPPFF